MRKVKTKGMVLLATWGLLVLTACGSQTAEEKTAEPVAVVQEEESKAVIVQEPAEIQEVEETSENVSEMEAASEETLKEEETVEEVVEEVEEEEEEEGPKIDWDHVKAYDAPQTLYAQSKVNVRKGPDKSFDKLGTLKINDPVQVIGKCDNAPWYEIQLNQEEIAFVHVDYFAETEVDLAALQAAEEAAAMAAIEAEKKRLEEEQKGQNPAPAVEQPAPAPAAPYIASPAGVVFVGDSRCVQMSAAVGGGNSTWICENSKRVSWMEENAVPRLDNIVGKGTKVVICMGVNDPWDYNQYAALANRKAAEWAARGARTYFVSVNPVWENPYVTQEQVDTFNANMPGLLNGVTWIDTASIVKQGGYKLVDGLHYDTSAYINLFNLICGSL